MYKSKLIKKTLLGIIALFLFVNIYSYPVSKETAQQIATNFLYHTSSLKTTKTIKNSFTTFKDSISTYYTFNFEGGGWSIIAADDNATPILAYSTEGFLNGNNINPSARMWLEDISSQIYYAAKSNSGKKSASQEWKDAINNEFKINNKTVSPLLKCKWDQTKFYNDSCPSDANAPDGYN